MRLVSAAVLLLVLQACAIPNPPSAPAAAAHPASTALSPQDKTALIAGGVAGGAFLGGAALLGVPWLREVQAAQARTAAKGKKPAKVQPGANGAWNRGGAPGARKPQPQPKPKPVPDGDPGPSDRSRRPAAHAPEPAPELEGPRPIAAGDEASVAGLARVLGGLSDAGRDWFRSAEPYLTSEEHAPLRFIVGGRFTAFGAHAANMALATTEEVGWA